MTPFEILKTTCTKACHDRHACAEGYRAMLATENISQLMAVWRANWEDIVESKYADIVTEDELKGYEAILEKVKSEIPQKPEKDEKQN